MKITHIKSITNRYGEREHSFQVGDRVKTYCIPVGARQSVDGLLRMLEREHNGPNQDVMNYVSEGLGEK